MEWEDAAILRRCVRCVAWLPLSDFGTEELVCAGCWSSSQSSPRRRDHARIRSRVSTTVRGLRLTQKARDFLAADRVLA